MGRPSLFSLLLVLAAALVLVRPAAATYCGVNSNVTCSCQASHAAISALPMCADAAAGVDGSRAFLMADDDASGATADARVAQLMGDFVEVLYQAQECACAARRLAARAGLT